MKHPQPIDTDEAIESGEGVVISGVGDDVVARRDEVAGIEADADARRSMKELDDGSEMLEAISQRPPLPRRVLEQHHRFTAWACRECCTNRVGDETKAGVFCAG